MIFLRWLNAGLLIFGASMGLMLGVVCLIYAVYLDSAPQLREEWPLLLRSTVLFCLLAAVAGLAFRGLLRSTRWRWYAQALLALTTLSVGAALWRQLIQ